MYDQLISRYNPPMTTPVLLKIAISLASILMVNRLIKNLALSIASGALIIALWSGQSSSTIFTIALARLISLDNGALMLLIALVITLSNQMSRTGTMKQLVAGLQQRLNWKSTLAALPAVIGLLPMPGGALFSAPLVDDADGEGRLSGDEKTAINYWFRHIWEFTWPLYPGVLVAADIAGIEVWQIFLVGLPVSVAAALGGYLFILRPITRHVPAEGSFRSVGAQEKSRKTPLLPVLTPIGIVVTTYVLITLFLPLLSEVSKYLPMIIGLAIAIAYLQLRSPLQGSQWRQIILDKRTLNMVLIVAVVRIYGAYIEAANPDGVFLMEQLRLEMEGFGVPMLLLMMFIPFISGLTTGVSVGFVGASFPIVFSLLGPDPSLASLLSTMAIAYPFGFMGTMLSPVHVCLIVTNEHFKTALGKSLVGLLRPALLVMAAGLIVSYLIRLVM